jgi:hypothetical protein
MHAAMAVAGIIATEANAPMFRFINFGSIFITVPLVLIVMFNQFVNYTLSTVVIDMVLLTCYSAECSIEGLIRIR